MACDPMGRAIELQIRNGSVSEALTLLAVLRANVSVQIGGGPETYLFVQEGRAAGELKVPVPEHVPVLCPT